jgi:imidazole glycerol-phosphate synthase subunit HisH
MSASVAIVDYRMGNLRSVANAFLAVGAKPTIVQRPDELDGATHLVIPGVGAFADGMKNLHEAGWVETVRTLVSHGDIRLLGICLGMQLLAEIGTEHGHHEGLGLIAGTVHRLDAAGGVRVPHIGWNDVEVVRGHNLFEDVKSGATFYFLHSYAFDETVGDATAYCTHGQRFAAAVERENVFGVQFHPEKSQAAGLAVLARFTST